ncbi:MAG: class B sortase [Bacilli bacterium]|nr:class B sortase [Bacilli bacterium]
MNNEYNDYNKDDEYTPRHANDFYQNSSNDLIIDNNLNYINTNDDNILDTINNDRNNKKKKRKKKKNTTWIFAILFLVFISIIVFCLIKIFVWGKDNKDTSKVIDDINNAVNVTLRDDDDNTELVNDTNEEKTSDYWYYIKFPLIDVDITELKDKNSDTVGWINVNNTNINYPFVQGKDNSYYLSHSFDKKYNEAGWVFLDYRNSKDLNNKNTILYAHSRLDKTMFGSLSKVLKSSWYNNKDNHIIRLSTDTENTLWQIFSVYKIPEESYYITTNFNTNEEYSKFLNTIKQRSIHNFNTNLDTNDKILTLSTCYSDTERTVVHAKLIKRSPK